MSTPPLAGVLAAPGVTEAVAEARAAVDALRRHRVLPRYADGVAAEAALRGARASAALAGADVALPVARRALYAGDFLPEPVAPTVEGALRVVRGLDALRPIWMKAPLQVLARLHTLAAAGSVAGHELGRPRADPDVAARLRLVVELLTSRHDAPAVVLAAVVHGELLSARPFVHASGLVARAAERLTLISDGLDPDALAAPEVGHLELGRSAYDHAAAGYATGGPEGVVAWVRHCAQATVLGARDMVAFCEAVRRTG
jgi:hypothetical protein